MPQRNMEALLLCHTPEPETAIALAGRLCYSDSDILSLKEAVQGKSESFVKKLISLGHLSPIEHASFTFAAQGVSRALLAQITRHRIASFSVQSQRYVKKDALDYIVPPSVKALGEEAELEYIAQIQQCEQFYQHWLSLGNRAQWEIRALAWAMLGMCMREAPSLFSICGPFCASGACPEGKMSCGKAGKVRERLEKLKELAASGASDAEISRFARENCI